MEQEAQAFSPSSLYENGLKMLKYESLLQEFLRFYARYQGTLDLENSILLFQSYRQVQKPDTHRHWRNGMQTAKRSVMEKKAVFSYMLRKISRDVPKK